ncbi:MAG TPA: tRNA sulfurtransferase [Methanocorpusculum sp.]|nr:tRNA sulfurtransferase [Methanocorpusculum sp.]
MKKDAVMVRVGELWLKSEPVKRQFIKTLVTNLKSAMEAANVPCKTEVFRGRIILHGDADRIADVAAKVFGIVDVAKCIICENTPESIAEAAVSLAKEKLHAGMRFAVRARRQFVEGFTSQQLAAYVADRIWDVIPDFVVDLTHPEYEIFVEAREFGGFVYDEQIPAQGGLPLGTAGRCAVLLSAGIDSPVAAWLMMRRGVSLTGVFADSGRFAGTATKDLVKDNARILSYWCPGRAFPLWIINVEPFLLQMQEHCDRHYTCLFCKRFMIRIAERISAQNRLEGVVTGENLGQVASQTLQNMGVITASSTIPLLRPLLTYDKEEIVAIARRIGTFHESPGDTSCRAVPIKPATCSPLSFICEEEDKLAMDSLIDEAIEHAELWVAKNGTIVQKEITRKT